MKMESKKQTNSEGIFKENVMEGTVYRLTRRQHTCKVPHLWWAMNQNETEENKPQVLHAGIVALQ